MEPEMNGQNQGIEKKIADGAKQTAKNAANKAKKEVTKKALKAVVQGIMAFFSTPLGWIVIGVIAAVLFLIISVSVLLDLFKVEKDANSAIDSSLVDVSTSTEMLYDYLRIWECTTLYQYRIGEGKGGKYVGKNGYYTIYYEASTGTYNIAYGLVTSRDNNTEYFSQVLGKNKSETLSILYSYKTNGQEFTHLSADGVEKVFELAIEKRRNIVKSELGDSLVSELKQYQIDALTAVKYQYGNIGNFKTAYNTYYKVGNKDSFRNNFKVNGFTPFNQGWEGVHAGNNRRATANWTLFDTGVYGGQGYTLDPSKYGGGSSSASRQAVVDYAKSFIGGRYVWGGTNLKTGVDCSGFVYCIYKHFGIDILSGVSGESRRTAMIWKWAEKNGKTYTDFSQAKPGDLVMYNGHVAMLTGNGKEIVEALNERLGIKLTQNYDNRKDVKGFINVLGDQEFHIVDNGGSATTTSNTLTSDDIYYQQSLKTDSGSHMYAQNFAITNIGTDSEIIWYVRDGYDSDWKNFYVRGYNKGSGSLVSKRTYKNAGHQGFDAESTSYNMYNLYIGSYGATKYDYYSKSTGIAKLPISLGTETNAQNLASSGVNFDKYISLISKNNNRIALLRRFESSTVYIYSISSNFSNSFEKAIYSFSIGESATDNRPIQGIALYGNYLYVVTGYGNSESKGSGMYIDCYDITTGNKTSSNQITVNLSSWEPEGIRVYSYQGESRIFLNITDRNKGKSVVYLLRK